MTITKTDLIDALADNIGKAQAKDIVEAGIEANSYQSKNSYQTDEAVDILEQAKSEVDLSSLGEVSVTTTTTRIKTGGL
jgi:nucleoid DNA-binding protein